MLCGPPVEGVGASQCAAQGAVEVSGDLLQVHATHVRDRMSPEASVRPSFAPSSR